MMTIYNNLQPPTYFPKSSPKRQKTVHFPLIFPIFLGFYNFMLFLANGWIVSTAHHYANAINAPYPCYLVLTAQA
ncbi:hypothetical protein AO366_0918 [Moraxella catarrhalis]|uniref:hypothetical protein n=1 Tax=Moraxella catarrhalis TaxID=480 RepID=UPI0007F4A34A|nr:hypothetical protein [Moraxella catarrhalis]OAV33643.1 hypothetical protein AO366_0918 [Moraxella catarrhalis]